MDFQTQSQSLLSRLHLSSLSRPAALGIALCFIAIIILGAFTAGPLFSEPAFEVTTAAEKAADAGPLEVETTSSGETTSSVASGEQDASLAAAMPAADGGGSAPADAVLSQADRLCVHVDGAVKNPGVYYLDAGARVIDAVEAAGGLTKKALTASVNLAQGVEDGQQVLIPSTDSTPSPSSSAHDGAGASDGAGAASIGKVPSSGSVSTGNNLVNINEAGVEELVTLSGIGEATAAKIVADREANGPFASLEDLKRVSGIGDKKFEALRDAICL